MTIEQPILVDTWGWLAFGHRRDAHHEEVKQIFEGYQSRRKPLATTDYILDELITLLFRRENHAEATGFIDGLFASAAVGNLRIHKVTSNRFHAALELRKRLRDKPLISFTDLTTMVIMQELQIAQILTADEHFQHIGMGFVKAP